MTFLLIFAAISDSHVISNQITSSAVFLIHQCLNVILAVIRIKAAPLFIETRSFSIRYFGQQPAIRLDVQQNIFIFFMFQKIFHS